MYTGNIDKDFKATLIDIVANCVAEDILYPVKRDGEIDKLETVLVKRMREIYRHNTNFGMKLEKAERGKYGARDSVYMWMEHWAKAWLTNPNILLRDM